MSDNQEPRQFKQVGELTPGEHHQRLMTGKLPETDEWIELHKDDDESPALADMSAADHLARIKGHR